MIIPILLSCAIATASDSDLNSPCEIPDIKIVPALPGQTFREPIQVLSMPGVEDRLIIVERRGRVVSASKTGDAQKVILDLRNDVTTRHSEEGLLSLCFHPEFPSIPICYVYRSMKNPRRTVLSRFHWDPMLEEFNQSTEEIILEITQPYGNHNGGTVLIGPDGMLYLSVGDGGSANDPHNAGQRMDTMLGKILRIDVGIQSDGKPYAVPKDNPFVGQEDVVPEIWATGLRNVWRMSFDSSTGVLWAGDVGQNAWEEIDIIEKGGNYGWKLREGRHNFSPKTDSTASQSCIDPVIEYGRSEGGSVTGGVVSRSAIFPSMDGIYFYGDYMSGRVWAACRASDGSVHSREITGSRRHFPSSFGVGPQGEVLICSFRGSYQRTGEIMRVEPQ